MGILGYLVKRAAIKAGENVAMAGIVTTGSVLIEKSKKKRNSVYIKLPVDLSDYVGRHYLNVCKELRELGFTNIVLTSEKCPQKDHDKRGQILEITINNQTDCKKNEKLDMDSEIAIVYYSLKKAKEVVKSPEKTSSLLSIAYCSNCGQKVGEGDSFCFKCGYKLS